MVRTLDYHNEALYCNTTTPTTYQLPYAVVCTVDVRKMKIMQKYTYKYQVNELAFLGKPTSNLLLQATGNDGVVELMSFPDMNKVGLLRGHTASVLSIATDPAERYIVTGGADAIACLWDSQDFICQRTFIGMDFPIRSLNFSYDSKYLAMVGEDPCVFVENIESGCSAGKVALKTSPEDCAWHPTKYVLAYPVDLQNESLVEFRIR